MLFSPFLESGPVKQAVLNIDGQTFEIQSIDIWALPRFVAALMRTTGQSWEEIVTKTPLRSLIVLMEQWNVEETAAEIDLDKVMERSVEVPKVRGKSEDEIRKFISQGGLRIKDG